MEDFKKKTKWRTRHRLFARNLISTYKDGRFSIPWQLMCEGHLSPMRSFISVIILSEESFML